MEKKVILVRIREIPGLLNLAEIFGPGPYEVVRLVGPMAVIRYKLCGNVCRASVARRILRRVR